MARTRSKGMQKSWQRHEPLAVVWGGSLASGGRHLTRGANESTLNLQADPFH
jgi:hypothetical protein